MSARQEGRTAGRKATSASRDPMQEHIDAVMAKAPPLTTAQIDRIAGLLRPLGGEQA